MKAILQFLVSALALATAAMPPPLASAVEGDSESGFLSESRGRTADRTETLTTPDSSLAAAGSDAADAEAATPAEEKDEVVDSEEYDAALKRTTKPMPAGSATALAKQQLSAEEYAEAEKEVVEELETLNRYQHTTTTTKAPGLFKETAVGLKNFITAPFRATQEILTKPSQALSSNMGSATLAANKVKAAVNGEDGGWKEVVRDWWRIITMHPERLEEAERVNRQSAITGQGAARKVMNSESGTAEAFGESLKKTWEVEQYKKQLDEESKTEEQLEREFRELMSKAP